MSCNLFLLVFIIGFKWNLNLIVDKARLLIIWTGLLYEESSMWIDVTGHSLVFGTGIAVWRVF